jgi:PhnB protein
MTMENAMHVEPYLFFNGRCEEALAFYRDALGAEIGMMMRFRESPEPCPDGMLPPGADEKIMHASFRVGATTVMASDGMAHDGPRFAGVSLSITVATEAEADRVFNALAAGGAIEMPIGRTFWSPRFGVVRDRFGVSWMVNADA